MWFKCRNDRRTMRGDIASNHFPRFMTTWGQPFSGSMAQRWMIPELLTVCKPRRQTMLSSCFHFVPDVPCCSYATYIFKAFKDAALWLYLVWLPITGNFKTSHFYAKSAAVLLYAPKNYYCGSSPALSRYPVQNWILLLDWPNLSSYLSIRCPSNILAQWSRRKTMWKSAIPLVHHATHALSQTGVALANQSDKAVASFSRHRISVWKDWNLAIEWKKR